MSEFSMPMPSLFIGHGSPTSALLEDEYTQALRDLGRSLPRPRAIVAYSAHAMGATGQAVVSASSHPRIEYDFSGFQRELYELTYPCPGSPEVATEVSMALSEAGVPVSLEGQRGLDHGLWVPLRFLFPNADIPVVPIAPPIGAEPLTVLKMGKAVASLREKGILVMGSGGIVHNLTRLSWSEKNGEPYEWGKEFDRWVQERVFQAKIDELIHFEDGAPHVKLAQPEPSHFLPLFFTLGAALSGDQARRVVDGFQYRSLSLFSFLLDSPLS